MVSSETESCRLKNTKSQKAKFLCPVDKIIIVLKNAAKTNSRKV